MVEKEGKKITIKAPGSQVEKEFDFDVWKTLQIGDRILVLLDTLGRRDIHKGAKNRNIFGLNERADILWQIQDPDEHAGFEKKTDSPFVGMYVRDKVLRVANWNSYDYDVDIETGKISNATFTK